MARPTSTHRASYEYFRDVPLRRLNFLLLAIFCLFGMLGFLIDLIELRQKSCRRFSYGRFSPVEWPSSTCLR